MPGYEGLISGTGEGSGLGVYRGHPAADGLHPLPVIHAAHISDVHEAGAACKAAECGAAQHGLFHLGEAGWRLAEHNMISVTRSLEARPRAAGEAARV